MMVETGQLRGKDLAGDVKGQRGKVVSFGIHSGGNFQAVHSIRLEGMEASSVQLNWGTGTSKKEKALPSALLCPYRPLSSVYWEGGHTWQKLERPGSPTGKQGYYQSSQADVPARKAIKSV